MFLGGGRILEHPALPSKGRGISARYHPILNTLDVDSVAIATAEHRFEIAKYAHICVGFTVSPVYLDIITRRVT